MNYILKINNKITLQSHTSISQQILDDTPQFIVLSERYKYVYRSN